MKTLELSYHLNSAIVKAFEEYIGKPRQQFGDCHKIVEKAIQGLLPANLEYGMWKIKPVDVEKEYDIEVFVLDTQGKFEKYKNSNGWKKQGKWLSAPLYIPTSSEDTVEGIIQAKQKELFKKDRIYLINQINEMDLKRIDYMGKIGELNDKIKILS